MAFLFTVENKLVSPNVETLLISPFKDIWERDKTKQRDVAIQEFTYVEFVTSQKKSNPFRGYPDGVKQQKVKESIFGKDSEWQPDKLIVKAIKVMEEFQYKASATYSYYISAKKGADKVKYFFITFDMSEVNPKTGNPVYKPKDITSALKDTDDVITKLDKLGKKVEEELYDKIVTKAQKEISPFADPNEN